MNFFRFLRPVMAFVLLVLPCLAHGQSAMVAQVASIPVTSYELRREMQRILPLNVSFHGAISADKINEIRDKALTKLVERAYKVQYALSEEIAIDNATLEKKFSSIDDRFKSVDEFEAALGGEGIPAFRASLYREMLAEKAEEVAVTNKSKISEEKVRNYYAENKASFNRPRQFKASHILVKVDPAANAEERQARRKVAEDLAAKAKGGEDFFDLAYYNSDDRSKFVGGDLGYFHEGQVVGEFEEAIKKMRPGDISDPIKTRFGLHIIKLVETNEPRQLTFEEVQEKIHQKLEKQNREALYQAWMQELKDRYPLQIIEAK